MHRSALVVLVLVGVLAPSCSDDPLTTTPPAAIDPTGVWTGTWTEDAPEDPATGAVTFSFLGDLTGDVEGSSSFGGLACLGTHPFVGTVAAFEMDGMSMEMEEGVLVSFEFDLRGADDEVPMIVGSFHVEQAEDCAGLEAEFELALQVVPGEEPEPMPVLAGSPAEAPLVARDVGAERDSHSRARRAAPLPAGGRPDCPHRALVFPCLDFAGDWRGVWRNEGAGARSGAIALSFVQTPDGGVLGLLALDAAVPHAFAGRVGGGRLAGVATAPHGSWIELDAASDILDPRIGGELVGTLWLASDPVSPPIAAAFHARRVAAVQRAPRPSAESSSSNTIGAFAGR